MKGMTLKQFKRERFLKLAAEYRAIDPLADQARFVALSVVLHAAKGDVPKRMWRYARRDT